MSAAFSFWLEVGGIVLAFGFVFLWGLFLVLLAREKNYQAAHARELAEARRRFQQPEWEMVDDAPFLLGKPKYEVLARHLFRWMGYDFEVPERYATDGASVPRWLWSLTGYLPDGKHRAAAVAHDYLCETQPPWSNWLDAADCFAHFQRLARVRPEKIVATYWAVVLFGPKWVRKEKATKARRS